MPCMYVFLQGCIPVVDGPGGFIPDTPMALREQGDIMSGPILSGINHDECSTFLVGGRLWNFIYIYIRHISQLTFYCGVATNRCTGLKQTWEIGRFSMKTRRYVGKTFMNSHKLNGESTRNILLNEALQLCAIRTGHSFQRTIIVNLFHYNRSLE